jgi:sugar-phosphatase
VTRLAASGILFDCDGVLADSLESAAVAWDQWALTYAPHFNFRTDFVHGRRMGDVVAELVAPDDVAIASDVLSALEVETSVQTLTIPGAAELTASLPVGSWTIVTSGARPLAFARLAAAGISYPDRIVTSDDVTLGKPHPEPYLAGAALLGLDPATCVVFEDAPAGIAAALAAGVGAVVGVGVSALDSGATVVVPDLLAVRWVEGALEVSDEMRLDV